MPILMTLGILFSITLPARPTLILCNKSTAKLVCLPDQALEFAIKNQSNYSVDEPHMRNVFLFVTEGRSALWIHYCDITIYGRQNMNATGKSLGHGPWVQAPTARPVYTQKLSSKTSSPGETAGRAFGNTRAHLSQDI